jgi:hypothetical protein
MYLSRKTVNKIQSILNEFDEADSFKLTEEGGDNGIGSVISMSFPHTMGNISGTMTVEVSGMDDW